MKLKMFGQRPSFGGTTLGFGGFGTNTSTSGFGTSIVRPTFGIPPTTSASTPFGSGTQSGTSSLFGQIGNQNQNTGGGLFSGPSSGFGSAGSGLFGSTNTQTSSSGGIFGTTSSSGFNANQNQARPFSFGTSTTSSGGTGTSLFGTNNASTGNNLFSSNIGQSPGTVVKYNPVTGTDTMVKGGTTMSIQTKIEVISVMKEYENRSLEELRVEDYIAGRKGPQQQSFGFGQMGQQQNKFGMNQPATSSSWLASSNTGGGLFGAKPQENKPLFGSNQSTPGFGTSTSGSSGGGLFGSSNQSPFGQSTTAPSTGFSFGQTNQNKSAGTGFSFGQTTSTPSLFGQSNPSTQAGTTFGSSGFGFGSQANQQGGLFGSQKPAFGNTNTSTGTGLFSNKPAGSTFGGFGNPTGAASPFGTTNTSTGGGLFGSTNQNKPGFSLGTSTSGFGSNTSTFGSGGLFGANNNQAKPGGLNFGTSGGFGTNTSTGFSFNQPNTGGGLFGNTQGTGGGGLFGNTSTGLNTGTTFGGGGGGCFGLNTVQPNLMGTNLNFNNANVSSNVVNNSSINSLIKALTHNPFGTSSLLKSVAAPTGKADELLSSPTNSSSNSGNPSKISVTDRAPTYVLPSSTTTSIKARPVGNNRLSNLTDDSKKNLLFVGLDEKAENSPEDPFKIKPFPSVKRLNLKVFKNSQSGITNSSGSATGQSTASNSIVNGNLNSGTPTNVPNSPGLLDTPTSRGSLTPLHENSPTPDIIKGRSNIKRLQLPNKNYLNDTLADLNVVNKNSSNDNANELDVSEIKENISIFDPPSLDELPDNSFTKSNPHPAGIKLTRAGYYTIPSLEDLKEMIDSDGNCFVENFTIGRYGYGNICFQGITNVSGLDLDSCVFIVRKEVEVYPEGVTKPPVGEQLNKTAFITLDCVWPVDKSTHEVIKAEERLDAMGWPQYLERQCLKMESTFVEYRPETGSWVFKVKHFSKYGLQDEENEPPTTQPQQGGPEMGAAKQPLSSQKENTPTSHHEISTKTPLALSNFQTTIFGGRSTASHGPPAMGLTSPPPITSISQLGMEPVPTSLRKKVFLDGSVAELSEEEIGDASSRDKNECAGLCPLSPSAERLTLSSKAPPRAIQSLKSQLFFSDLDCEANFENDYKHLEPLREKGEKRELSLESVCHVESQHESSGFLLKGFSKKLLLGNESKVDASNDEYAPSIALENATEKSKKPYSSAIEAQCEDLVDAVPVKYNLRDPRTEYPILTSEPDPSYELGPELTSHLTSLVSYKESVAYQTPKGIADATAFMGRSFRVGWGPRLTLVHCGQPLGLDELNTDEDEEGEENEDIDETQSLYLFGTVTESVDGRRVAISKPTKKERRFVTVEKLHLKNQEFENEGSSIKNRLEVVLETYLLNVLECSEMHSAEAEDSEGDRGDVIEEEDPFACHYFSPERGINLLHRLALTAAQMGEVDSDERIKLSSIFDLCAALWGRLDFYSPDTDGESEYAVEQARKEAVSVWLEEVSAPVVTAETERELLHDTEEGYLNAVISYLTARQISSACKLCLEKGDIHLSLLLSQVCTGSENPRQIMREQLTNWAWAGVDAHISTARLSLYTLVSGQAVSESSVGKINTCLGLDWKRCFAIHMWYVCQSTSSIAEVLQEYELGAGLTKDKDVAPYCQEPKPAYCDHLTSPSKGNNDVCFQLLKLYVDRSHPLENLLESSAHTSDPLDVTTSWLLWCILQSLDYTLLPRTKSEALHSNMAAILESIGCWHWSAFAILSLADTNKRKRDLLELLTRHLVVEGEEESRDPFYREKEHFIIRELKVPQQFVYKAKALRAKSLKLVDEEAWYLIRAGEYNEAHQMILDYIAPNAVINEDHEHLLSYLNEFKETEIKEKVVDWENGGAIYLAYLEVIQQVNELRESRQPTASKVEQLRPRLMALCLRLSSLKSPSSVHRLCISEMSRMVVSVLRALLSDDPDGIRVLAQQVAALPLTHECALEELNHITHQYLATISHVPMDTS